ncbi:hypothetical protein ACN28E_46735 [Archangium lansingense]|uniref:hypothetical protein n=1 Tax=Archangium lansingense TaxID=2995310 RepID=UPI003B778B07
MDDEWEAQYFGNLSRNGTDDFDSDEMTDLEEYSQAFNPTVKDSFQDADGDRYPNIFELRNGGDPNNASSHPSPTYTVNAAGGGTHTTVNAAVTAANVTNGAYQIIAVAPGVYAGSGNVGISIAASKPKLLIIGTGGAEKTVMDGGGTTTGWTVNNSSVIESLTIRGTTRALYISNSTQQEVRLVDVLVKDNAGSSLPGGLYVGSGAKVYVTGSTFLNNTNSSTSTTAGQQVEVNNGVLTLTNTVVWGSGTTGTPLYLNPTNGQLVSQHSLVKGRTLTGTGNLPGDTDPKLRFDGRLQWNSPLLRAGVVGTFSQWDMDLEARPATTPDVGADQWVDADGDELADVWEMEQAGNLTTLTGRAQDADSDGLTNEQEYGLGAKAAVADTDEDGLLDGAELNQHGTNLHKADTDGDDMPDGWEVSNALNPLVANRFEDADGDRYPNVFEYARSSNPQDAQSTPTPNYTVNAAGGGTHTTVNAAVTAANVTNGAYQIIAVAPGVYAGSGNVGISIAASKPKLLIIGTGGAEKTVMDGGGTTTGWTVNNSSVIESLTIRGTTRALYISNSTEQEVRLVDVLVKDNAGSSLPGGLYVGSGAKVYVTGSTFLNNTNSSTSTTAGQQVEVNNGVLTLTNTVVWGSGTTGTPLYLNPTNGQLVSQHSLVKGRTLTGTGNLPGDTDPKLRFDGRLQWNSPLLRAGVVGTFSQWDMDLEARPATTPDVGADQWVDADGDELADVWEMEQAGNLTTLTDRAQDADSDGLTNEQEYGLGAKAAVADTDEDGLSDGAELNQHGTNLHKADTDGDDMPDGWEVSNALNPLVANRFEDADGDRYPNVFEYARSSNPQDAQSTPTPNYTVNAAGGGTHTTVTAAVTAANVTNGAYQIIAVAPGVYAGSGNVGISVASSKPKLLIIGTSGAAKTVMDGGGTTTGWVVNNSSVIASLTIRGTTRALYISNSAQQEVRLVDLLVKDNAGASTPGGLYVGSGAKVYVTGSTFLNNTNSGTSTTAGQQVEVNNGVLTLTNTVVWGRRTTGTQLYLNPTNGQLVGQHSLVKGQTLAGTGNLPGDTDPKLRADARPRSTSPLRGAGLTVPSSRFDMELENRPQVNPDIGVDQWGDQDADGLPDGWELAETGGLSALSGTDADADELSDLGEYDWETEPLNHDTDGDLAPDGREVQFGTNPNVPDSIDIGVDLNQDGILDGIGVQLGYLLGSLDMDGDSLSNADELLRGTNPLRADSDGDGVSDGQDVFPLDPLMNSFPQVPSDVTPPLIQLTAPWNAVPL